MPKNKKVFERSAIRFTLSTYSLPLPSIFLNPSLSLCQRESNTTWLKNFQLGYKIFEASLKAATSILTKRSTSTALLMEEVVLIDEYDAPIIHFLGKDVAKAYENREILRAFYTVLKDNDPALEFVFITGVSKFSKVGIFSGLNNLTDLTMQSDYVTMFGYTQRELEENFVDEIEMAATRLKLDAFGVERH